MDRILKCAKFQAVRYVKSTAIFTGIFLFCYFAIVVMLLFATPKGQSNMGFSSAALIFAFLLPGVLYKVTFNNLLLFSNTRDTILASNFLCSFAFSVVLAVLSELGELLNYGVAHFVPSLQYNPLAELYNGLTEPQKMLWFFTLFLMVSMIGSLYGALSYKFGKMFKLVFWVGLGLLMMLTSLLANPQILAAVLGAAKAFFGYGVTDGVYRCSLHFFLVAAALGVLYWLSARRQPQAA